MNRLKRSISRIWQQVAVALGVSAVVVVVGCGDDSGLGQRYKVTGINPGRSKNVVKTECLNNGKVYIWPAESVRALTKTERPDVGGLKHVVALT